MGRTMLHNQRTDDVRQRTCQEGPYTREPVHPRLGATLDEGAGPGGTFQPRRCGLGWAMKKLEEYR
jgi:hypothetical protein